MRQKGFSLIELMVALVLGLLIVQAALSLFLSSSRNYGQDQKIGAYTSCKGLVNAVNLQQL